MRRGSVLLAHLGLVGAGGSVRCMTVMEAFEASRCVSFGEIESCAVCLGIVVGGRQRVTDLRWTHYVLHR